MKHFYFILFLFITATSFAQLTPPTELQAYYTGVDFTKIELDLFNDLAMKTADKHTNALSYTPGIWNASKITDEDPNNSANVVLFYGYSDIDGNYVTDTTRDKDLNGGTSGTDWNREHVFPNSLANPSLDDVSSSGPPYADGHNLRPSDVTMNGNRGNKKFASGTGNAANVSGDWYPGDEWKGDAARIIMYMYIRYGTQCYPSLATQGTANSIDSNMINLLLEWNAQDPVSIIEDNRNTYHTDATNTYGQGNRNPFIDNPYLATVIWGGTAAENRWGAQPPADTEAPTVPTNVIASNPTSSTVDLTWMASTDNTAVTAYDIFVNSTYNKTVSSTATIVTGLAAATPFTFTVLAKDAANNMSAQSTGVMETTLAGPPAGSDCAAEDFENIPASSGQYLTRTWTGVDNIANGWTATDARTDQALNGKSICVRNGTLTSPSISGGIGDLTVTTQLTFGGSAGTFDVLVNGSSVGSVPYSAINTMSTTTTISNIDLTGNITVVLDNQSTSNRVRIDDLSWTCYSTLSVDDFPTISALKLYPNPVSSNTINVNTTDVLQFAVYDILGKRILNGKTTGAINIEALKKGIYIIKLENKHGSVTKKLVRQ